VIGMASEGVEIQKMKYLGIHRLSAGCNWLGYITQHLCKQKPKENMY
jgi:hypothetical protein